MIPAALHDHLNSLFFRVTALFLLLLALAAGGYFLWIDRVVSSPYDDEIEAAWYEEKAEAEIDSLAREIAGILTAGGDAGAPLVDYGARVADFEAELLLFAADGVLAASSDPDSLDAAVPAVDRELLVAMAADDWDFSSYPVAEDVDAFENRIFDVLALHDLDEGAADGYLVASFRPLVIGADELETSTSLMDRQTAVVTFLVAAVIWSALSALLILAWTSRRVARLTAAVGSLAEGRYDGRLEDASRDEIGRLTRHFNRMADDLAATMDSLRAKEQFQRQLVANISHDLRTPLASLRGHAESLQLRERDLDTAARNRGLAAIMNNADHLQRLVERMLVLSRFDADQIEHRPESFSLPELADEVLDRCEALAAESDIELALECEGTIPPVAADPLQIAQLLQNLVENGIKHNTAEGSVVVSLRQDGERVAVAVRDTGPGIPESDLPHIFERFYTGDPGRTRSSGATDHEHAVNANAGLGLAIAARIAEAHGTRIGVSNRGSGGAEFSFSLAVGDMERAADAV